MAEGKKSVLLYCDIIHTVEELTNEEAGVLFKHYLRYINDLNPVAPDKLTRVLFEPIKQDLKRDLEKWREKSKQNSDIAKARWRMRTHPNASDGIKRNANDADNDTVTVIDNDNVNEKDYSLPEHWRTDYQSLVQYGIIQLSLPDSEIENFFDYYYAKDFTDANGSIIKNWKSALKAWRDKWNDKNKKAELEKPKEEKYFKAGDQYLD